MTSDESKDRTGAFVFGEVADDYERVRPGYPAEVIDEVIEWAGPSKPRILEIGAGTGKATHLLAGNGFEVVALEPSAEMARIATSNLRAYPEVTVEPVTFEGFEVAPGSFDIIVAAQAWHWVGGDKYARARELLAPAGVLAAFWNHAVWPERQNETRRALEAVYSDHEPQLLDSPAAFPGFATYDREQVTAEELDSAPQFGEAIRRRFGQMIEYSNDEYLDLLGTQSIHRMLDDERRAVLMDGLNQALRRYGESITVEIETRLVMARRA